MPKKISIKEHLKILGISKLKDKQKEIINSFLRKKDTIGILPTGYGKSICYFLPYLMKNKSVIVISPLISLMEDQNNKLNEKGIKTIIFNSTHGHIMQTIAGQTKYSNILKNNEKYIIYFSPESFIANQYIVKNIIQHNSLSLIAIDECHCISTWSDFRSDYKNLSLIKDWIEEYKRKIPILCLTATATKDIIYDIVDKLKLKEPNIIKESIYKDNLKIFVHEKSKLNEDVFKMKKFINNSEKGIIYCKTRKDTETLSKELKGYGVKCNYYHAGLNTKNRSKVQNNFSEGKIKIIIATIAFGMGIDISDINLIIHYGISKNLESYYQEIGRGGRDGKMVKCHIIWSNRDFSTNRYFLSNIKDQEFKQKEMKKIIEIEKFVKSNKCRMKLICQYFDDNFVSDCGKCDNCINKNKLNSTDKYEDISNNIIKQDDFIINRFIVLNTLKELSHGIGMTAYYQILKGSKSKNLKERFKSLKSYGKLKHCKVNDIKEIIRKVLYNNYLQEIMNEGSFGSYYKITQKGHKWLNNNDHLLCKSFFKIEGLIKKYKKNHKSKKKIIKNNKIYDKLIEWRNVEAKKANWPTYCILKDKIIEEISKILPNDSKKLLKINGIGPKKLEKYGEKIIKIINSN